MTFGVTVSMVWSFTWTIKEKERGEGERDEKVRLTAVQVPPGTICSAASAVDVARPRTETKLRSRW